MTTGERMKDRRKQLGLSAEEVAERLGCSPATIYRYEKGDIEKIAGNILDPISKILHTTPAYLMGWDDDSIPKNIQTMPELQRVPRLGAIACGTPILAEQNIEDYDLVPAYVHADFSLLCKGDSMINARIFDGDIVCIRQQSTVENGDIAAVLIGDEATLKRVRLFDDHVILQAENPTFADLIFWGEEMEQVRILGKATHFISAVR